MSDKHNDELASLVKAAYDALEAAQAYAVEHDLQFNFEPSYGMGGTFKKAGSSWQSEIMDVPEGEYGWYASSMSC